MKQKNKPVSIQDKIVQNYLRVILSMSVIVLVTFNFSMRLYINKTAQAEIAESRETVKVLLRDALKDIQDTETLLPKAREFAKAINQSFKLTELTSESEIALINASGEVLLPKETDMNDYMRIITSAVVDKLSSGSKSATFNINYNNQRYLVSYDAYNETVLGKRSQYLVIVTSQNAAMLLLRRINFILIAIVCLSVLIGTDRKSVV